MLFRTGDQSRDFAVVLATNRPADLDAAVIDRMDEAIEFPLPGDGERQQILWMYIDSYIAKAGTSEGTDFNPTCSILTLYTGEQECLKKVNEACAVCLLKPVL